MTTLPIASIDAEQRRAALLRIAAEECRLAPAEQAEQRRWFTGELLKLTAALTADDLAALSYTQVLEIGGLVAAAVAARPDPRT